MPARIFKQLPDNRREEEESAMKTFARLAPLLLSVIFALPTAPAHAEDIRIGASISLTGTYAKG